MSIYLLDRWIKLLDDKKINYDCFIVPFNLNNNELKYLNKNKCIKEIIIFDKKIEKYNRNIKQILLQEQSKKKYKLKTENVVFMGEYSNIHYELKKFLFKKKIFKVQCYDNFIFKTKHIFELSDICLPKLSSLRYFIYILPPKNFLRKILLLLYKSMNFLRTKFLFHEGNKIHKRKNNIQKKNLLEIQFKAFFQELFNNIENEDILFNHSPLKGTVVHISPSLNAGGAERQLVNTLIGLKKSSKISNIFHLCEFLNFGNGLNFYEEFLLEKGIKTIQRRHNFKSLKNKISFLPSKVELLFHELAIHNRDLTEEVFDTYYEIRKIRPYIIHSWLDETNIKSAIAGLLAGTPKIIISTRNFNPSNFCMYKSYFLGAYQALSKFTKVEIINNSYAGSADYEKWIGLETKKVKIIRNGFNSSFKKNIKVNEKINYKKYLNINHKDLVIGSIFRFYEEKNPILWLKVALRLKKEHQNIKFLIIGDGPMRKEMEKFIFDHNMEGFISLPGVNKNISLPLSIMDIFLLTSRLEGTPNVLLEAQSFGIPIVSTDAGGSKESFVNGKSGLLSKSFNSKELAECVTKFIKNKTKRSEAKASGPKFVEEVFGMNRMISETLNLYKIG